MAYEVRLTESATTDLFEIKVFVAHASGLAIAEGWDERLRSACLGLATFPSRGTPRDDLGPGLRSIAVRRRATIFYRVEGSIVEVIRVLYAGRDVDEAFGAN